MNRRANIVPPQARKRFVMRRVKARWFAVAALASGVGLILSLVFGYDALRTAEPRLALWLLLVLAAIMWGCGLMAGFFRLTEKPRQIEVTQRSFWETTVIHLSSKQ